jgi:hypothetical protein
MAAWGRRWLPPILFGGFLYGLIVAYAPPAVAYNAWVGQTLYLGSALLLFWSGGAVGPWHWDRQVGWALLGFGALMLLSTWGSPKIYQAWPRLALYGGVMLWASPSMGCTAMSGTAAPRARCSRRAWSMPW